MTHSAAIIAISTEFASLLLSPDAQAVAIIDRVSGLQYDADPAPFAGMLHNGQYQPATALTRAGEFFTLEFGDTARAVLHIVAERRYFTVEVLETTGDGIEQFTFFDVPVAKAAAPESPFAVCALALNLQTQVPALPGPQGHLKAVCYPRFGFAGAKAAIIACPAGELRAVMQEAVSAAPDLPHSPLGGPWAADAPINRGSYLFNFTDCTEQTVDDWIALAKSIGFTQIDFHGGQSFRFGDCVPNPALYPDGRASLKRVVDRLHDAGLAVGLHTYAFFIDTQSRWVTPVPDPRLGCDAVLTLASPLAADSDLVPVVESTAGMSTVTGFFVRNSVTLRIDDELITYTGLAENAFTGCERGAHGTTPATHAPGAKIHHLKECFGLFTPEGDSTLLAEVAAATAETFNTCGFDMMYLDALDGEDILGGPEHGWHYGSKYVFELWKRLERPALMEMSTFHHHLWYVRSRIGAWDHPARAYKPFIDNHCASNAQSRFLLPGHLGWWAELPWQDIQSERTFPDDHEYLCAKAAGTDTGFSIMGITPASLERPAMRRVADILRRWENLRHAGTLTPEVKARLRAPGEDFILREDGRICPARYLSRVIEGAEARMTVDNPFAAQPLRLRIEARYAAAPGEGPDGLTVVEFTDPSAFVERTTARGVVVDLQPSDLRAGAGCLTARNDGKRADGAWAMVRRAFTPLLNIADRQALGLWVHGDGRGEVLNCQLRSPLHISNAFAEHYVVIDFTGWRYFTLIECEAARFTDYRWPYKQMETAWGSPEEEETASALHWFNGCYHIYREKVHYDQIEYLSLWLNNIPAGGDATLHLGPIHAMPLRTSVLATPTITVNGAAFTVPATIETGQYLELEADGRCTVYGPDGSVISEACVPTPIPLLAAGRNEVAVACAATGGIAPRANLTLISQGPYL